MYNKRIIITGVFSIILVSILFIGNTLSIQTINRVDPNINYYNTASLDISYKVSDDNLILNNSYPLSYDDAIKLKPYRMTVFNKGDVNYKFNLILQDDTETDKIDYKYIMVKIGNGDAFSLASVDNNIIYKDMIIKNNSEMDIDIFVWLSDDLPNSEIGKGFYGKIAIDGYATKEDSLDSNNFVFDINKSNNIDKNIENNSEQVIENNILNDENID